MPRPPTHGNRATVSAVSSAAPQVHANASSDASSNVDLKQPTITVPNQLRSNIRHIEAQSSETVSPAVQLPSNTSAPFTHLNSTSQPSQYNPNAHSQPNTFDRANSASQAKPSQNIGVGAAQKPWLSYDANSAKFQASLGRVQSLTQQHTSVHQENALLSTTNNKASSPLPSNINAPSGPTTPRNQQPIPSSSLRTPASVDRRTLARDILRSLIGKRKRTEEPVGNNKRGRQNQSGQDPTPTPTTNPSITTAAPPPPASTSVDTASNIRPIETTNQVVPNTYMMLRQEEDEAEIDLVNEVMTTSPPKSRSPEAVSGDLPSEPVEIAALSPSRVLLQVACKAVQLD